MIHELEMGWRAESDHDGNWHVLTLHPAGDVFSEAPALAEELWAVIHNHSANLVVLDMHHVWLLPSSLMGVLVRIHKRLAQHGGTLHLCRLSTYCHEALRVSNLDRVLPVFSDRESAIAGTRAVETLA